MRRNFVDYSMVVMMMKIVILKIIDEDFDDDFDDDNSYNHKDNEIMFLLLSS